MGRLLGLAFAIMVAIELGLAVVVAYLVAMLVETLWRRSPSVACALVVILLVAAIGFWRSRRGEAATSGIAGAHPGISVSRIPITGAAG